MRLLSAALMLLLVDGYAQAQDPGAAAAQASEQAMQQATQQAVMANQQATQAALHADDAVMQGMRNAQMQQDSQIVQASYGIAAKPKFSVKPGSYSSPKTVKLTDSTRGAIIYYSTDGWTPTAASKRYLGPITIDSTTTLQAVAVAPNLERSFVAVARYTVNSAAASKVAQQTSPSASTVTPEGNVLLPEGSPVPLLFGVDVSSRTAEVGDQIPMELAEDLKSDGMILAKKGTPALATVVQVDKNRIFGLPGVVSFQVEYMNLEGTLIRLCGAAAREGEAKLPTAAVLIPVVGPLTAIKHGTDATIKQGTPFTASLFADTFFNPMH
jgi:hypothetical protein